MTDAVRHGGVTVTLSLGAGFGLSISASTVISCTSAEEGGEGGAAAGVVASVGTSGITFPVDQGMHIEFYSFTVRKGDDAAVSISSEYIIPKRLQTVQDSSWRVCKVITCITA